jgi:hypothetical protein
VYDSFRSETLIKEIHLVSIKNAKMCELNGGPTEIEPLTLANSQYINNQKCLFKLVTDDEVYFCGMDASDTKNTMNVLAKNFFNIFKMVYFPHEKKSAIRYLYIFV